MTIRIGIIGLGVMGADHAHTLDRYVNGAEVTAIADVNGYAVFASASDEPPAGGQFSYVDWGAGQVSNAVMLIQTDTTWSGSTPLGGSCLTAPGGAGSQVTTAHCDATDDAQWWIEQEGK